MTSEEVSSSIKNPSLRAVQTHLNMRILKDPRHVSGEADAQMKRKLGIQVQHSKLILHEQLLKVAQVCCGDRIL